MTKRGMHTFQGTVYEIILLLPSYSLTDKRETTDTPQKRAKEMSISFYTETLEWQKTAEGVEKPV